MKTLSIISLLIFLAGCTGGGNLAKIKLGKRCTEVTDGAFQESSFIWLVGRESLDTFDRRITKENCKKVN
tara:strand:+ start:866 stop:1075 length:210 start_codon:yes stop_codon:yes gene_type:complete